MAFLRLIEPNSRGLKGEVISREQALKLKALQKDYANQPDDIKAKLDNIAGIYIPVDKPKVEVTVQREPQEKLLTHEGILQGMSEQIPRGDR